LNGWTLGSPDDSRQGVDERLKVGAVGLQGELLHGKDGPDVLCSEQLRLSERRLGGSDRRRVHFEDPKLASRAGDLVATAMKPWDPSVGRVAVDGMTATLVVGFASGWPPGETCPQATTTSAERTPRIRATEGLVVARHGASAGGR
jgi:hypothetical protein